MTAHLTETDMATFEGALDETVCHVFHGHVKRALCGFPREEQPPHTPPRLTWTDVARQPNCPACGLIRCPTCARLARRFS